ncbi:efflux RND transporter permease subunit [Humidisolicoccus flavus]|uniref:efflux RND transporter permease subunit n=1 Tax=Humidisolicoccus flavus TaxID=3111414 RepID=UPI00324E18C3
MHLLSRVSLKNRALIALITVCVAIFGGVALNNLKVELAPDVEFPQVAVITAFPGVSPEIISSEITEPLEAALQAVPDLVSTTGTSSSGSSVIAAEFTYGVNLATTEQRVQQIVNRMQGLPDGVTPQVLTGSIADLPVIQIAVTGGENQAKLADDLQVIAVPDLQDIEGVREAEVLGAQSSLVLITPDQAALAAVGLNQQAISTAIDENGTLIPAGTVDEGSDTLTVQLGSRLDSVDDISSLPLVGANAPDGGVVTVGDVANVELTQEEQTSISLVNGEQALTISITKASGANTVDVSNLVTELLPQLQESLGGDVELTIVFDQAPYIEQSIEALAIEGVLGLIFAVLVILIFLMSIRSTLVTAISIPVSVLITFVGLWATGYSMNILTLGALTISIGRVVDDSIVVIENIKRHLPLHKKRGRAILVAVKEVAGAITASTVTTVIVFLPLAFVGDITGELFRPFAITVSIALIGSLFVALTIVPVLAYWFLRAPKNAEIVDRPEDEKPDALRRRYLPILTWTLKRPAAVLISSAVVFAGSVAAAPLMGQNFLGDSGQNTLSVDQALEPAASLETRLAAAEEVQATISEIEGVEIVQASIGGGGVFAAFTGGGSSGTVTYSVTTDPAVDQEALQETIRQELADADYDGDFTVATSGGGFGTSSDIAIDITATSPDDLTEASLALADELRGNETVAQVSTSLQEAQPIVEVSIDRDLAAAAGFSELQVAGIVAAAMQPQDVGTIQLDGRVVTISVAASQTPEDLAELQNLQIPTPAGPVALSTVASVERGEGPVSVSTADGVRNASVTITPASADVSATTAAVQDAIDSVELPAGATASIGGVATQITDSLTQLGIAALIAVLLVYIVMVATFKSMLQPLLLLVSVPFAATGAILLQLATGIPLGVASMVGVLMLIGVVVTNAIVLVDLVNQYRDRGMRVREAIIEGSQRRLRPILMTAAATIFALIPMALGITGHGGFISQPLAIVVIGGLVSSTVLTLIVLPVLLLVVEGAIENRRLKKGLGLRSEENADLDEELPEARSNEAVEPELAEVGAGSNASARARKPRGLRGLFRRDRSTRTHGKRKGRDG